MKTILYYSVTTYLWARRDKTPLNGKQNCDLKRNLDLFYCIIDSGKDTNYAIIFSNLFACILCFAFGSTQFVHLLLCIVHSHILFSFKEAHSLNLTREKSRL